MSSRALDISLRTLDMNSRTLYHVAHLGHELTRSAGSQALPHALLLRLLRAHVGRGFGSGCWPGVRAGP